MAGQIWFGRPGDFRWMPAPATGMSARNEGYSETINFENGRASVVRSKASHKVFEWIFPVQDATEYEGLDVYSEYATGLRGIGDKVYWADPMNYDTNLFPPGWAAPALQEQGWKSVAPLATVTYLNTAANSYLQPSRTATFNLNSIPANTPAGASVIIPIPPSHTLSIGHSGANIGAAAVVARPINFDGTYATVVPLTPLNPVNFTRYNATFAGSSFSAVEVYLRQTTVSAGNSVTITSLSARLDSLSLPTTDVFVSGKGTTGMKFADGAISETYVMQDRHLKGMSTSLVEVD